MTIRLDTTTTSLASLKRYCEAEQFKGWDPYDGLNSRLFQAIPFASRSALLRLCVIQGFKRCPINLRTLALVPKQYNAKGIALLLSGYCRIYQVLKTRAIPELGTADDALNRINELATILISLQSRGDYHGACWGYNFDWQARRLFLFPKNTPTVVATTFAVDALLQAFEITGNTTYRDTALSASGFVLQDLHRTPHHSGFLFSYSPLQGNDTVYNASLLGSKLLSLCFRYTGNDTFLKTARQSVEACCKGQRDDGAWVYGLLPKQAWVDSFHTGYNLDALATYRQISGDNAFDNILDKGFRYYIENFFLPDGTPKYYDNRTYPIDIHCPGQLFVTLDTLGQFTRHADLAQRVLQWTVAHMQDRRGYFYYQLKPRLSSKISYMRWSNAFMLNALATVLRASTTS